METCRVLSSLVVILVLPRFASAQFETHTGRGAALGGVAGALAGAAIGNNNHNTPAGAMIGGAAGLITGAAIGSSIDEREQIRAYQQQQAYQLSHAVSIADVVTMSHNGVSDDLIINQIRQNGMAQRLDVRDVITLHKQGVSEAVLTAMQQYTTPVRPAPTYSRPVIVNEYRFVPPPPHYYYHGPHHPYFGPPRSHWGITLYGR